MPLDAHTRTHNDTLVEAARINPRIPIHISRVLAKAMAVKGEERIQTITELVAALFEQHTIHMEHSKGATQTIPIQHIPKQNAAKKANEKKEVNKTAVVIGWVVLGAVLLLSVFLLYELFSVPSGDDENSSKSTTSMIIDDTEDSDDYVYGTTVATAATTAAESQSEYGVGSIMPNVVGMDYAEVEKQLGGDFTLRPKYYYSDTDEKGYVKSQSIEEGADYDPELKNELTLDVCAGPENVPIPEYSGISKTDYVKVLDSLNIKYKIVSDFSSTVSNGYVMGTDISVGSFINVKKGETLTVTVSAGVSTATTTSTTTTTQTSPTTQDTDTPIETVPAGE